MTRDEPIWVWYLAAGIVLKAALVLGSWLAPATPATVVVSPHDVTIRCEARPATESVSVSRETIEQIECVELDPAPSRGV